MKLIVVDDLLGGLLVEDASKGKGKRKRRPYSSRELLSRLLAKTTKGSGDACWIWTGYTRNGYGSFCVHDHLIYLHQLSWALHNGPLPVDKCVLHRCDVRRCVRPDHLFLGTQQHNVDDMWSKGRARKPPRHYGLANHKATKDDVTVAEAISMRLSGAQQREVAWFFGIGQATVWRWVHGIVRTS